MAGKKKKGTTDKPRSIIEYVAGKPSRVLRLIVDGLRSTEQYPDQRVKMMTYGNVRKDADGNKLCAGCAATWVFQAFKGEKLSAREVAVDVRGRRRRPVAEGKEAVERFEMAVDRIRSGGSLLHALQDLTGLTVIDGLPDCLPPLESYDWRIGLSTYEALAEKLEKEGL
jgi:hypothetical protein